MLALELQGQENGYCESALDVAHIGIVAPNVGLSLIEWLNELMP